MGGTVSGAGANENDSAGSGRHKSIRDKTGWGEGSLARRLPERACMVELSRLHALQTVPSGRTINLEQVN